MSEETLVKTEFLKENLESAPLSLASPRQWKILIETKPEAVPAAIMKAETAMVFSHVHPYMTLKNGPSNSSCASTSTNQPYSNNNSNHNYKP
jgi:hypothetical protein